MLQSLAYILADAGYDVWMMNIRGNQYSKGHINLNPGANNKQYWSFGLDEPARYGTIHILRHQKDWVGGFKKWQFSLTFSAEFMLT